MGEGFGNGKIILFGEHFVVHNLPAIAGAISNKAIVKLIKSEKTEFFPGDHKTIPEMTYKCINNIFSAMNIKDKFKIYLKGNLPTFGGLGSSAAFCVAIVRALDDEYSLHLTANRIIDYSYQGERAFHGNPSGIDNTISALGGVLKFTRGKTPSENKFEKISLKSPLIVIIGITGIFGPTSVMVAKVGDFKKNNPEKFENLSKKMIQIISNAQISLERREIEKLGRLMDENQILLKEIGVSIKENDRLIKIMKNAGALGAKITGGGGGGCCTALAKDQTEAKKILKEIKINGFDGFLTIIE
ncbi:MAG: mevalonate kinase [Candidatus Micrarchaeia archaeon]